MYAHFAVVVVALSVLVLGAWAMPIVSYVVVCIGLTLVITNKVFSEERNQTKINQKKIKPQVYKGSPPPAFRFPPPALQTWWGSWWGRVADLIQQARCSF